MGIDAHLPPAASSGHDLPPNAGDVGATSEQQRAQARSHAPTASDAHLPADASWSHVYLLLFGGLFEHVGHFSWEHDDRHLPAGTIDRDEHEGLPAATIEEQFAVFGEGEMSEQ